MAEGADPAQLVTSDEPGTGETIVVTGSRAVHAALRGIDPARSYDEADVAGRGSSTVGEFVDEVRGENGDEDVIFLVDGEPVADLDDLADYPAEAIAGLEVLPRGAGQKVGREANRRVYSITLKNRVRNATLSAAHKVATEGDWGESRGEAILTNIEGRDRLNLTIRARRSDRLFDADRGILQRQPSGFASANYVSPAEPAEFRTLRPDSRNWDASLIGSAKFASWLSSTYSLRGRTGRDIASSGLPYGLFQQSLADGSERLLGLYGETPLDQRSERHSLSGNFTLNGTRGKWLLGLTGQFSLAERTYRNEREESFAYGPRALPDGLDPQVGPFDPLLSRRTDRAKVDQGDSSVRLSATGPLMQLPAGSLRMRAGGELVTARAESSSTTAVGATSRVLTRNETRIEGGIDIPLASRRNDFLPAVGELSVGFDAVLGFLEDLPNSRRSTLSGLWQPSDRLSLTASQTTSKLPPATELLADPVVAYDNVAAFDFISGETAFVTILSGGNPGLASLDEKVRQFTVNASVWRKANLQLFGDYRSVSRRNFVAAIPPASAEIFAAFPDRFQRDAQGRLILIDSRPVNFDRQDQKELRYGFGFSAQLGKSPSSIVPPTYPTPPMEGGAVETFVPAASGQAFRLQGNLAHTIVFEDRITIRPDLGEVDLLDGGAIGLAGGRPRHQLDGSLTLSRRGMGAGASATYRGASTLATSDRSTVSPLRFSSFATVNLRAFADLGEMLDGSGWLKQTRITLTGSNILNDRQFVSDATGVTPLQYQAAYRDPIGRTIELEIRKVF